MSDLLATNVRARRGRGGRPASSDEESRVVSVVGHARVKTSPTSVTRVDAISAATTAPAQAPSMPP